MGKNFNRFYILMKSLKQNNHGKADDHEEGTGKSLLDIGFFEKYIAIQNAHKET